MSHRTHIRHFAELVSRGRTTRIKVVLYVRCSSRGQSCRGNRADQLACLREHLRGHPVLIIGAFEETASRSEMERRVLLDAIDFARKTGAVVVAESVDRFIRSELFNPMNNPSAQRTVIEFERLKHLAGKVKLATIHHPDTPWKEIRGCQSIRGQSAKRRKGGGGRTPGWRKRRKHRLQPKARWLHRKELSFREIARELGVSVRTAWMWTK